jgi:hypothetical protein
MAERPSECCHQFPEFSSSDSKSVICGRSRSADVRFVVRASVQVRESSISVVNVRTVTFEWNFSPPLEPGNVLINFKSFHNSISIKRPLSRPVTIPATSSEDAITMHGM